MKEKNKIEEKVKGDNIAKKLIEKNKEVDEKDKNEKNKLKQMQEETLEYNRRLILMKKKANEEVKYKEMKELQDKIKQLNNNINKEKMLEQRNKVTKKT